MRLASEEDLDDLIESTDKEYLIQVNRWLVRTIHGDIYPDGHTATTATNKLIHTVESPPEDLSKRSPFIEEISRQLP
jgi:hypothetical protein